MKDYPRKLLAGLASLALASPALADTVLVDRGLPTQNLNNAAGADRSNVSWADTETSKPGSFALPGDNFKIGGTGAYKVTDIRVWDVGDGLSGYNLYGGLEGGTMGKVSSSFTSKEVTYQGGASYESGATWPIYQIDFNVDLFLNAGDTFDFFLGGPFTESGGLFYSPFLHASNAAESGSPQQGSDDTFLWLMFNNDGNPVDVESWLSGTGGGTTGWGPGWDKNSDGNVQVIGEAVPDVTSAWVLLTGSVAGLAYLRRKL